MGEVCGAVGWMIWKCEDINLRREGNNIVTPPLLHGPEKQMVTFYNYTRRRFKKVANARAVIWKMLLVAEKRFRRLKAPHLMKDVYQGAQYVNGVPVNPVTQEKAA